MEILAPVRAHDGAMARALERICRRQLAVLELTDSAGVPLIRIISTRARSRARRWQRDDLSESASLADPGLEALVAEPDVEAYLGGWG